MLDDYRSALQRRRGPLIRWLIPDPSWLDQWSTMWFSVSVISERLRLTGIQLKEKQFKRMRRVMMECRAVRAVHLVSWIKANQRSEECWEYVWCFFKCSPWQIRYIAGIYLKWKSVQWHQTSCFFLLLKVCITGALYTLMYPYLMTAVYQVCSQQRKIKE